MKNWYWQAWLWMWVLNAHTDVNVKLHSKRVDPLSNADWTHELGCQLEGLDLRGNWHIVYLHNDLQPSTNTLCKYAVRLSWPSSWSISESRPATRGRWWDKCPGWQTWEPRVRHIDKQHKMCTWFGLLFSEQCSGARCPTICPTDKGGGQNGFRNF